MIDLHTHSLRSDGSESPSRVVELAAAAGCTAVALTDHDRLDGLPEAQARALELEIELVPGCEVSCDFEDRALHVLCYFVAGRSGALQDELGRLRADRDRRNHLLAERLQALGLPITLEDVIAHAPGMGIGRPHFAALLVARGLASDVDDAFNRYLGKGRPGYIKKSRVTVEEIVERTARSGGVAVVAHPCSLDLDPDELERQLHRWADAGLAGCECYYARYAPELRNQLARLARRCGLVPTGGSDFHGTYRPGIAIGRGAGDLDVADELLDELKARRPAMASAPQANPPQVNATQASAPQADAAIPTMRVPGESGIGESAIAEP